MTPERMIDTLRRRCLNRDDDPDFLLDLAAEIDLAQEELEQGPLYPFWMLKVATIPSVVTDSDEYDLLSSGAKLKRVAIPDDFIKLSEEHRVCYLQEGCRPVPLIHKQFDELSVKFAAEATATPKFFAIRGEYLYIVQSPGVQTPSWGIMFNYIGRTGDLIDGDLTRVTENAWHKRAPFCLINRAGIRVAKNYLKDEQLGSYFDAAFSESFLQLQTQLVEIEWQDFNGKGGIGGYSGGS